MNVGEEFQQQQGGCACGQLRYALLATPLFVHCCYCSRCQRETGGPFAHHLMLELSQLAILSGEPAYSTVPTDSGRRHLVAHCPQCQTALWNEHGSRKPLIVYLRVGTLDQAHSYPPQAHIFVRSKPAWLNLTGDVPQFAAAYDSKKIWPAASLQRYAQAQAERKKL